MQQLGASSKYHQLNRRHPIHEEYRQQCNQYSEMICKAKAEHWAEWLEGIDESSIWDASKLLMMLATDAGKSRIPTLQIKDPVTKKVICKATNNTSKGQLFYNTFFPPPNPTMTTIPENPTYLPPQWTFTNITDEQIH